MTITLWIATAHHTAFRCGGWASVRVIGAAAGGYAGGERATTAARMALAGLVAGLRDLPVNGEIAVHTAGPELARVTDVLAGRTQPEEDIDLWAQILSTTMSRRVTLARAAATPDSPLSFAAAWAALAMDKAKAGGAFAASIPKGNLAKALRL